MRIVKNYGRTHVEQVEDEVKPKRILRLNKNAHKGAAANSIDFPGFTKSEPKIIIAQWISIIDKIYSKPKGDFDASKRTRKARTELGEACWRLIKENKLLPNIEKYKEVWEAKLHPYDGGKYNKKNELLTGRLFATFDTIVNGDDTKKPDVSLMAQVIFLHLYKRRIKTSAKTIVQEKEGFIERRANSIEKNTLAGNFQKIFPEFNKISEDEIDVAYFGKTEWTKEDEEYFAEESGDLARKLKELSDSCFEKKLQKDGRVSVTKKRPETTQYISLINEHFKQVLKPTVETKIMRTLAADPENGERNKRVMLLYTEIREFYKKLFRSPFKKNIDVLLPKSNEELMAKLRQRQRNRSINNLIRLGKILHYEGHGQRKLNNENNNGPKPTRGSNKIWSIEPHSLATSYYFSSDGQASIKSTEAFLRIWRSSVSLANRSLNNFSASNKKIDLSDAEGRTDVLGGQASLLRILQLQKDAPALDGFSSKLQLQFGTSAKFFEGFDPRFVIACLFDYGLAIRQNTFHFGDRGSFSKTLSSISNKFGRKQVIDAIKAEDEEAAKEFQIAYDAIGSETKKLTAEDLRNYNSRMFYAAKGVRLDYFLSEKEFEEFVGFVSLGLRETKADFGLAKFSKLLVRHAGISGRGDGRIEPFAVLPEPVNRERLEAFPALRAKFVALKMVYEGPFKEWLACQEHEKINEFAEAAIKRTSDAAISINSSNRSVIEAQANKLPQITEGQKFIDLISILTAATATEMRVQKTYESDSEKAKEQAEWINEFKMDLLILLFNDYCNQTEEKRKITKICELKQTTKLSDRAVKFDMNKLDSSEQEPWEDWATRLYVFLHFVPVDEANLLYQQFLKWGALKNDGKIDTEVETIKEVFLLYSKMHDDKFSGNIGDQSQVGQRIPFDYSPFTFLFDQESDLRKMLGQSGLNTVEQSYIVNPDTDTRLVSVTRGLREVSRFGYLPFLNAIHQGTLEKGEISKISQTEIDQVKKNGHLTKIKNAQQKIQDAAKKKTKSGQQWSGDDVKNYKDAVEEVNNHRVLMDKVTLTDITKLHKIMTELFGRMVDFSAQWERDQYFILLASVWLLSKKSTKNSSDPKEYINGQSAFIQGGRVPQTMDVENEELRDNLKYLKLDALDTGHAKRNQFAHFGFLDEGRSGTEPCNFTQLVVDLRSLMSYDYKLKNSITKSLKELLKREGFVIDWKINSDHELEFKELQSDTVPHLLKVKNAKTFKVNKHSDRMLSLMKCALSRNVFAL